MNIKRIYIYAIYFPSSNKYYIGQTNNLKRRMDRHLKSGSLICKALWKYSDWQITILHTRINRDEANLLEIESIRNFKSIAPNGYNLTAGGDGSNGCYPSKETRKKMSKAAKGNQNSKGYRHTKEELEKLRQINLGNQNAKGYKHSKEELEKISRAAKGRKHSEESKKKFGHPGNQFGVGKRSLKTKKKMQVAQLKRRIKELEGEI